MWQIRRMVAATARSGRELAREFARIAYPNRHGHVPVEYVRERHLTDRDLAGRVPGLKFRTRSGLDKPLAAIVVRFDAHFARQHRSIK